MKLGGLNFGPAWLWPLVSVLAGGLCAWFAPSAERIVVLSVGQGDSALIQSSGRSLLIDVGPAGQGSGGLVHHLSRYGVGRLDAILLSHPDADHIGALPEVLAAYPDTPVLIPAVFRSDERLSKVLATAHARLTYWTDDADGTLGGFQLVIREPNGKSLTHREDNLGSMFVEVRGGLASYLTSGDAPAQTEEAMKSRLPMPVQIMHVGHHGSRFSSSSAWLATARPEMAIVSCGLGNRYGHPSSDALARLEQTRAAIYRTDQIGDIELDLVSGRFVKR